MKAYHLIMYLLLFNLFFWVVTTGLGIYSASVSGDEGFDLSDKTEQSTWVDGALGLVSVFQLFGSWSISVVALGAGIAAAATVGWTISQQAPQGIVYGLFGYVFWSSLTNTLTVFYNMTNQNLGALYVLVIFGMIISLIFVAGMFQMITGGWAGVE